MTPLAGVLFYIEIVPILLLSIEKRYGISYSIFG